jgi:hypothetical protein
VDPDRAEPFFFKESGGIEAARPEGWALSLIEENSDPRASAMVQ